VLNPLFGASTNSGEDHIEFGKVIKNLADATGEELLSTHLFQAFEEEYLHRTGPFALESFHTERVGANEVECTARISIDGIVRTLRSRGNGPIDAFVRALNEQDLAYFELVSYAEHSLGSGAEAQAIAYIQIRTSVDATFFGAATDTNIELASVKAVLSALNRSQHC
jgi:2-isopropylmalate synthase